MNADVDFYDQYDDLATEICDNPFVNEDVGLSNQEMVEEICNLMNVEYFDLFDDLTPKRIEDGEDLDLIKAYAFLYYLRWQVFYTANEYSVGLKEFNEKAIAHSEMWYIRLTDRYRVLQGGGTADKTWVN